jgi:nucleoside-diphosphate-sugar epimerase
MRVVVTGGTGFIGSHSAATLTAAGHDVRLFVRSPEKVPRALTPHGLSEGDVEVVEGDITDPDAVKRALDGADAVLHGAAVFSLNPNDEREMARVNPESTDLILRAGRELGLDPIVYISTAGVFLPPSTQNITGAGPLGEGHGPYTRSKVAAERVARRHQGEGGPVVIVYPGVVLGPHDPNEQLSDSMATMRNLVKGRVPALPRPCPLTVVDVRDVAALNAAAMKPGRGARHYLICGKRVDVADVVRDVARLTGRRLPVWPAPKRALAWSGRLFDWLSLRTGKKMPLDAESLNMMLSASERPELTFDQSPANADFGLPETPLEQTLRDMVRWLCDAGHISTGQAGKLASARSG